MGELLDHVQRKYELQCRLQSAELEVTHRCPCNCQHCFLFKERSRKRARELSTEELANLFIQLREEGVIELTITGGEPFLREDLPAVLAKAHQERFRISILTTGILIGPAEVELLRRTAVEDVELSILGATAETHDSIMGHPGAFERLKKAVGLLQAAGVVVNLKATILRSNFHEVAAMQRLAERLKAMMAKSLLIAPAVDGDLSPQKHMLSADQAADLRPQAGGKGALLTCKAGRTFCGITPEGDILPCILFRRKLGNIREKSLSDIWHTHPDPFLKELREWKPEDAQECIACKDRSTCRRCPGITYLETGDALSKSPAACLLARGTI